MSRETDVAGIEYFSRSFIKTQEWEIEKTRDFYFAGYEKVMKVSQRTGNEYALYYIYLLEILEDETVCAEETLSIFPSQAGTLKTSGVKQYQEVTITKRAAEKGETYEFVAGKKTLAEKDRPPVENYPEVKAQPVAPAAGSDEEFNEIFGN